MNIKLKTIKDLPHCDVCVGEGYKDNGYCCKKQDLRELGKDYIAAIHFGEYDVPTCVDRIYLVNLIKQIFNLTEEDLK